MLDHLIEMSVGVVAMERHISDSKYKYVAREAWKVGVG